MPVVPHRSKESGKSSQAKRQIDLPVPFETPTRAVPLQGDLDDPIATTPTARATEVTLTSAITTPRTTGRSVTSSASASTSSLPRTTASSTSTRITSSSTRASTSSSSAQSSSATTTTAITTASSGGTHSLIFPNSFPPDFPVQTVKPTHRASGGRGYAFLQDNELADSMLIFAAFLIVSLVSTIVLVKSTHFRSRRQGSKVDQMVGEDMKWQERREVLERRIIYEKGGGDGKGRTLKSVPGKGAAAAAGWRELKEIERRR